MLLYASKYHDIPTVVNVSGRYNLVRGIAERMGKDFFEQIKKDGYFDVKNKKGSASVYHLFLFFAFYLLPLNSNLASPHTVLVLLATFILTFQPESAILNFSFCVCQRSSLLFACHMVVYLLLFIFIFTEHKKLKL